MISLKLTEFSSCLGARSHGQKQKSVSLLPASPMVYGGWTWSWIGNLKQWSATTKRGIEMQVRKVISGQMWKCEDSGEVYVVTTLYKDVLSSFALLRLVNHDGGVVNKRAKITRTVAGEEISGFTIADLIQSS